jgi:hypothetical protein
VLPHQQLVSLGRDALRGRHLQAVQVAQVDQLKDLLKTPSAHFILWLHINTYGLFDSEMFQLVELLYNRGMVYLIIAGEEPDRLTQLAQTTLLQRVTEMASPPLVPVVNLGRQPAASAAAMARNAAVDALFGATCQTVVLVNLGYPDLFEQDVQALASKT